MYFLHTTLVFYIRNIVKFILHNAYCEFIRLYYLLPFEYVSGIEGKGDFPKQWQDLASWVMLFHMSRLEVRT